MYTFLVVVLILQLVSLRVASLTPSDIHKAVQQSDMGRLEWLLSEGVNPDYFEPGGDRWTPLIRSVSMGSYDFVDRLLRARANPNQAERDGWTPLHFAAAYGHMVIARTLIEAGADVNAKTPQGVSVIDLAKEYGKWEVLETLETAKQNNIPPSIAAERFHRTKADNNMMMQQQQRSGQNSLLKPSTGNDLQEWFRVAVSGPNAAIVGFIKSGIVDVNVKTPESRTAMHLAAQSGNVERVRILVEAGAYINELDVNSWSPLMFAAKHANFDVVQYLLTLGADPFLRDIHGISAYVLASENGHQEISSMITSAGLSNALRTGDEGKMLQMMRAGADPDSRGPNRFTALLHFAGRGNIEAVQEIVRLGADVNIQDVDKWSPLMFASFRGDIQNVIYLINNGADLNLKNKVGDDALAMARREGFDAVVQILESFKGRNLRANVRPRPR